MDSGDSRRLFNCELPLLALSLSHSLLSCHTMYIVHRLVHFSSPSSRLDACVDNSAAVSSSSCVLCRSKEYIKHSHLNYRSSHDWCCAVLLCSLAIHNYAMWIWFMNLKWILPKRKLCSRDIFLQSKSHISPICARQPQRYIYGTSKNMTTKFPKMAQLKRAASADHQVDNSRRSSMQFYEICESHYAMQKMHGATAEEKKILNKNFRLMPLHTQHTISAYKFFADDGNWNNQVSFRCCALCVCL